MNKVILTIIIAVICILPLFNCPILPYTGDKENTPSPVPGTTATPISGPTVTPVGPLNTIWAQRLGEDIDEVGMAISGDEIIAVAGNIGSGMDTNILISVFDGTQSDFPILQDYTLGGFEEDEVFGIVSMDGFIAVTGSVRGDAELDGTGVEEAQGEDSTGYGESDAFVTLYSANGDYLWSKRLGGVLDDSGQGVTLLGNPPAYVAITGYVTGDADLDGDGTLESTGFGQKDIFVSVFSISDEGVFNATRSKRLGGFEDDAGYGIACYETNKIVVTGFITDNADLDANGIIGVPQSESVQPWNHGKDIFLTVFNATGENELIARFGGAQDDWGNSVAAYDKRIAITGRIDGTVDLNGNTGDKDESVGTGGADAFFSVFENEIFSWAKRIGGDGEDEGFGVGISNSGPVIVCGKVTGDADLDSNTIKESEDLGGSDAFVSEFGTNGLYLRSGRIGGTGADVAYGLFVGPLNRIMLTGTVTGYADLDADGNTTGQEESPQTTTSPYSLSDLFFCVLQL